MSAGKVTHLPLAIPGLADQVKSFFCAVVDMNGVRDPLVMRVIAERNARLLFERENGVIG